MRTILIIMYLSILLIFYIKIIKLTKENNELHKVIDDSNLRYIVSMRALINATKLLELGMDKTSILRTTIIKNMQTDDLNVIMNKLKDCDWKSALKKMCDGN